MITWTQFVERWKDCDRCPLHEHRTRIVLARGKVPCDVLFIGEAPGASEDVLGLPFVGPAGKLLDAIISEAMWIDDATNPQGAMAEVVRETPRLAFTNLVCCLPTDEFGDKGEPEESDIRKCSTRLAEFVAIARPKLAVCVGALASKHVNRMRTGLGLGDARLCDIVHPAAILRATYAQKGLMRQRAVVTLRNAVQGAVL